MTLTIVSFVAAATLVLLVVLILSDRNRRLEARVQNLSDEGRTPTQTKSVSAFAKITLPKIARPLLPENQQERSLLRSRLVHAGYYGRTAMGIFLGIKMLLLIAPPLLALAAVLSNVVTPLMGALLGLMGGCIGLLAPGMWLDWQKRNRQTNLRRALPDALDVTVICLEGGLSLQGGFQRVATSLGSAHPLLASEMAIIQREIQLGRSTGDALRQFAERSDLEEVRSLASVVLQAERLGASIVKTLRVHAETLRVKRLQRAEELAHMAGTKMVFPTLLCIFPAILFVVAGPAAIHIVELFASMK